MKKKDIVNNIHLEEENGDVTEQKGEETNDRSDLYRPSPNTPGTDNVEINVSDVIYVGSSTEFANASDESMSLLYTTVNHTDAPTLPEHNTLHHVDA